MKLFYKTLAATVLGLSLTGGAWAAPVVSYDTGLDANGAPLADGAQDTHYSLISGPAAVTSPSTFVVTQTGFPVGNPWVPDSSTAKWISFQADQDPGAADATSAGLYHYQTTFDLSNYFSDTAVVTGNYATDNSGFVSLNGGPQLFASSSFGTYTAFTLSSGFTAGVNTLDFYVTNSLNSGLSNPTGLIVNGLAVNAVEAPEIDATSAALPLFFSVAGLLLIADRRKKALI